MGARLFSETCRSPAGGSGMKNVGFRRDTVKSSSGIRGRSAGKVRVRDHEKSTEISTRQYLQIGKRGDLVWEILSLARRPTKASPTWSNGRAGREASAG